MKKFLVFFGLALIVVGKSIAQETEKNPTSGEFQFGLRTTGSFFSGDAGYPGMGVGGQMRLRISESINTEWFGDFFTTDIGGLGKRNDAHIGWSVMFYPLKTQGIFKPFFLAGHCFDYSKVQELNTKSTLGELNYQDRWSSAVQMGLGTQLFIAERFDIGLSAQYMLHLGNNDIHASIEDHNGAEHLHIGNTNNHNDGVAVEGHLLLTLSLNLKIADLW